MILKVECFTESIKINKIFLPSYFGYIFSLFGKFGAGIINILIFMYRLFRKKVFNSFGEVNILMCKDYLDGS